jgi:5-methyltetrahydrofolate--homocysteine methyltransferase
MSNTKRRQQFLEQLRDGLLVWDGAMGTQIHALDLDIDHDYQGCENCTDILSLSCPEQIGEIHRAYLAAGADVVSTNTFGGAAHVLGEFDRADDARAVCRSAAEIARGVADEFSAEGRPRYVAGSLGPGTKLITLGQIGFDDLRDSYAQAAIGLIEGGVDCVLIETCQDLLQIKCAVQSVEQAERELGVEIGSVPIFVSVTIEQTGTMLVGSSIEAAIEALRPLPISALGLNCATGPVEMMNHVRTLAKKWDRPITVMPNAGLPVLEEGKTVYPLGPESFVKAVTPMLDEGLVDAIGGCCGTTPEHIAKLRAFVDGRKKMERDDAVIVPSCSSLYSAVEYRQDLSLLIIGERCNASGSRKFKRLLEEEDFDGIVSLARQQVRDSSHVIDINVDVAGRDNARDMHEVVSRIVKQVDAPLMLDSTNPTVILAGLKASAGKCIVNSANFEEGDEKFDELCAMAKQFGAGLVIGTIDEDQENAMARTAERKLAIASRGIDRAVEHHGMKVSDLFIDPLVLPVSTGMDSDRRSASELIEGTKRIAEAYPEVQLTCGLSNVSFGLKPSARVVINAVLMHELVEAGMTSAILHASKITPLHRMDETQKDAALDLIFDRRSESRGGTGLPAGISDESHDPLSHLIDLFQDETEQVDQIQGSDLTLEEKLRHHIINGEREHLEETIESALEKYAALEIINDHLLDGMKTVGELFGSGQMQLPFVLQSAEVMKRSVALLEPYMEKADSVSKGSIVLATVKGDVHDIGKNLVDILLSNNGFTVHNLGIKQPIDAILKSFKETNANAIGLSGLLVKSVNVMEENLVELNKSGIGVPVLLGGAALTRSYAEGHLTSVYEGDLHYAKDAFDGLDTMNAIVSGTSKELLTAAQERAQTRQATIAKHQGKIDRGRESSTAVLSRSSVDRDNEVPEPPFWGTRVVEDIPLNDIFAYINPTALFSVQWQLKRGKQEKAAYERMLEDVARPKFEELKQACLEKPILQPRVVYGYFPCSSDGDSLVMFDPEDHDREVNRFAFPRQRTNKTLCISDFYRDLGECESLGRRDVIGMMCVTMGEAISAHTKVLFDSDQYQNYLYWHGLGVEAAEGLAELWHKRIRQELGFGHEDSSVIPELFQQKYRGSRYSFGYPACPDMSAHTTMWELLDPTRIGCHLTENYQIDPEQSTCAIVSHHPEARYFNA